ncbi:hypothetical protein B0H16DRAFT_1452498 [Mycena metata]|uniref:Uncharacterized protein n=1 Tax=Mycena metata TaxID=1033252 RepID=A0AAD7JTM4_9AGAR|nr:hypothetical protein B0H16DRAFT_1452498 [Mycena metata]
MAKNPAHPPSTRNLAELWIMTGCGLCSTQLTESFCGRCKCLDCESKGLPDPHAENAAARRMGNPNPPNPSSSTPPTGPLQPITNNPVIGPTTSAAELEAIRNAKTSGGCFTVHFFYTTKGVVNKSIGNHTFNHSMEMSLDSVLKKAVDHADVDWIVDPAHPLSLKVEDCSLHFHNNVSIEPEALFLTLRGLYNFYINRPDEIHVTAANRLGLANGTYLTFECSINIKCYHQHVLRMKAQLYSEEDSESLVLGTSGKRSLSSNVRMKNNLGALGYGTPLAIPAKCVEVTFKHYTAQVHEEEAEVTQVSINEDGRIEVDSLILLISDRIFQFYIGDNVFAAKRFFDTGNKPNADGTIVVSKRNNPVGLTQDLMRLAHMEMFRCKFMESSAYSPQYLEYRPPTYD